MFPLLYQAHHNRHLDDLPFWLSLADQRGDPILELGCGTGRVTLPLAGAGHRMYGIDNDQGMLTALGEDLTLNLTSRVHVWLGDMTSFRIALNFPLIIMPCNTFSTLSLVERTTTLARVAGHLLEEGTFAVSLPNPTTLKSLPYHSDPVIEDIYPHPIDGQPVQVSSGWERTGDQFTVTWHYDHLFPDGSVERTTSHARHNLVSAEQIGAELDVAGLRISQCYGDFDGSPYSADGPYFIFLAVRD